MDELRDKLGQVLEVGDAICWATVSGSSSNMNLGFIKRINYTRRISGKYRPCARADAERVTISAYPIFGESYYHPTKEVQDPFFEKLSYWGHDANGKHIQHNPPILTYPGVKRVFDPDGKQPTATILHVKKVVAVDPVAVQELHEKRITENAMRIR